MVHGLLIAVASLVAEQGLWSIWASVVVAHRLRCSMACGVLVPGLVIEPVTIIF